MDFQKQASMMSIEKPPKKSRLKILLILAASTLLFLTISSLKILPILPVLVSLFLGVDLTGDFKTQNVLGVWASVFVATGVTAYVAGIAVKKWQPDINNLYFLLAFCTPDILCFLASSTNAHDIGEKIGMGSDILSLIATVFFWRVGRNMQAEERLKKKTSCADGLQWPQ